MVTKLLQNIFQRSQEGVNFTEDQTEVFRELFGNQFLEEIKKNQEMAGDDE